MERGLHCVLGPEWSLPAKKIPVSRNRHLSGWANPTRPKLATGEAFSQLYEGDGDVTREADIDIGSRLTLAVLIGAGVTVASFPRSERNGQGVGVQRTKDNLGLIWIGNIRKIHVPETAAW
jgi:hypothetical protein